MPSLPRAAQIDLSATPFYHCISRCVRRAFLCGDDGGGKNFDHRKRWFLERLRQAADAFAIDVCAYAILSNHFHVVLRVDAARAAALSDNAVLLRYGKFFPRVARAVRELPEAAQSTRIALLRERLTSLSWFMRVINEHVARRANKEDECTGRFWEGRFKCQPLLDQAALYTCMSYVDLNPIRAGIAGSLAGSDYTSIQQRLRESSRRSKQAARREGAPALAPLRGESRGTTRAPLELRFDHYVELLEWTGRAAGAKPGGRIRSAPPALLDQLGVDNEAWLIAMSGAGLARLTLFGTPASIATEAKRRGMSWLKGSGQARSMFRRTAG